MPQTSFFLRSGGRRWPRWLAFGIACLACPLVLGLRATASGVGDEVADDSRSYRAEVIELLPAGSYTYVWVETADGENMWIVVTGSAPAEGSALKFEVMARKQNFHSRRLQRVFSELAFAQVIQNDAK